MNAYLSPDCVCGRRVSVLQLRLNAQQLEEKRAAEAAVDEIKELIDAATSEASKDQLQEEMTARQGKLDELMAGFEVCKHGECSIACMQGARYYMIAVSKLGAGA